jgi:hypothetical protein
VLCIVQLPAFALVLKLPAGQALQPRSLVAVPAVLTLLPAAQSDQGLQLSALLPVLKLLAAQALQARLLVALPTALT